MDIQNMKYNMNNSTSNVQSMASDYIRNNYVIINDIIQYWLNNRDTSQESYSSDKMNIEKLIGECKNNKTTKWYINAFKIFIDYYICFKIIVTL